MFARFIVVLLDYMYICSSLDYSVTFYTLNSTTTKYLAFTWCSVVCTTITSCLYMSITCSLDVLLLSPYPSRVSLQKNSSQGILFLNEAIASRVWLLLSGQISITAQQVCSLSNTCTHDCTCVCGVPVPCTCTLCMCLCS